MSDPQQSRAAFRRLGLKAAVIVAVGIVMAILSHVMQSNEPTVAAPERTTVQIVSEPAGATVVLVGDGGVLGVTPFEISLPRSSQELPVFVRLAGYQEHRVTVPLFSATGRIDVALFANGVDAAPRAKTPSTDPVP